MKSDRCFKYYKDKIKNDPEKYIRDYKQIYEKVQKSTAIYHGEPVDFLYQPMFYDVKDVNKLKTISGQLFDILNKVTDEYYNNPEFRNDLGFPEVM